MQEATLKQHRDRVGFSVRSAAKRPPPRRTHTDFLDSCPSEETVWLAASPGLCPRNARDISVGQAISSPADSKNVWPLVVGNACASTSPRDRPRGESTETHTEEKVRRKRVQDQVLSVCSAPSSAYLREGEEEGDPTELRLKQANRVPEAEVAF